MGPTAGPATGSTPSTGPVAKPTISPSQPVLPSQRKYCIEDEGVFVTLNSSDVPFNADIDVVDGKPGSATVDFNITLKFKTSGSISWMVPAFMEGDKITCTEGTCMQNIDPIFHGIYFFA